LRFLANSFDVLAISRAGKTAKQALIDYNKPTLEEEELSRQAFNWFMGLRDDT
jgi:hypothetical protein